jgi:peptide deformylase
MQIYDFRTPAVTEPEKPAIPSRLVKEDTPFLQQKSEAFDWANPQMDPIELASLLVREMVDQSGLGLSAIQLGIPLRVFAIRAQPKHIVLFNPTIVSASEETESQYEGCLSYPNLLVKVKRAFEVRVRFSQPDREVRTEKWGGLTARIVQHEMDHLEGVLFFNRASKFHRDQAFRKQKQYQRTLKRAKG